MKPYTIIETVTINQNTSYIKNQGNSDHMYILGSFLHSSIPGSIIFPFLMDWLKGKSKEKGYSSITHSVTGKSNNVIITNLFIDYEETKYKNFYFKTTKKHLIEIIQDWMEAYYKDPRPQKIIITQEDDGSITFQPFDADGNEINVIKKVRPKNKILEFWQKITNCFRQSGRN